MYIIYEKPPVGRCANNDAKYTESGVCDHLTKNICMFGCKSRLWAEMIESLHHGAIVTTTLNKKFGNHYTTGCSALKSLSLIDMFGCDDNPTKNMRGKAGSE